MTAEQSRFVQEITRYHRVIGGAPVFQDDMHIAIEHHDTSETARLCGCMIVDIWLRDCPIRNVASKWLELFK